MLYKGGEGARGEGRRRRGWAAERDRASGEIGEVMTINICSPSLDVIWTSLFVTHQLALYCNIGANCISSASVRDRARLFSTVEGLRGVNTSLSLRTASFEYYSKILPSLSSRICDTDTPLG